MDDLKLCIGPCNRELPDSAFYEDLRYTDKRYPYCRRCKTKMVSDNAKAKRRERGLRQGGRPKKKINHAWIFEGT